MNDSEARLQRLTDALGDHSAEGIEILASEPSKMIQGLIGLIAALLLVAFAWSFIGRADVIVSAGGALSPDSDVRRFYAPIEGELVDIFIAEGQPVSEGDVLARLNARGAIQIASRSLEADLQLVNAERQQQRFIGRKELLQRQVEALGRQVIIARSLHEKRIAEGMVKMGEAQRAKLQEARGNIDKAARVYEVAKRELAKYRRLFSMEGGGGVSRDEVERVRSELVVAEANYNLAQAKLGELDFLLSSEHAEARARLEGSDRELIELQIQRDTLLDEIQQEQNRVDIELRRAQLEADAASRIKFENIDEDNFLKILAPVSGVVTEVAYTQRGDKVQANTPLGSIAAQDARSVLKIDIAEADRAFLRVGQDVKIKFNAFPYQRYGFIEGKLEYISPTTQASSGASIPVYKGRVGLERSFFTIENERLPLRFGMQATAEIVVRKRRIFDLVLDPFRDLKG